MELELHTISGIILLIILYFYVTRPRIKVFSEISFNGLLGYGLVTDLTGIFSALLMAHSSQVNHFVLMFGVKIHMISHIGMAVMAVIYITSNIFKRVDFQFSTWVVCLAGGVMDVIVFILPCSVYSSGTVNYFFGKAISWTFFCTILLIGLGLSIVIAHREDFVPQRRMAFLVWIGIWLFAAILYFFNPDIKFIGAAGSLCVLIVFIALENPTSNIDRETGFFNTLSFSQQMKHNYENNVHFSLFIVHMDGMLIDGTGSFTVDLLMKDIVKYFRTLENVKIFRLQTRDFAFIYPDARVMEAAFEKVKARFEEGWDLGEENRIVFEPFFMKVPYSEICDTDQSFGELLSFIHGNLTYYKKGQSLTVDFDLAREPEKRNRTQSMVLQAMKDGRVEVFYQPIYSLAQKKFVSSEALARIRDENGQIIMPATFIPVIESTGNIVQFGELVFADVCRFFRDFDKDELGIHYIEINVSIKQLEQPDMADKFIELMQKYGVSPSSINLEVTESGSLTKHDTIDANMKKLLAYGVEFSLDDFGSGESNLDYMLNMPVKIIKYDKDMTQAYFTNNKAKYVVPYVTELAHEMQLKVVSEGVENTAQLESMERFGVDFIQGYIFSRPLPVNEYVEFLRSHLKKIEFSEGVYESAECK